MRYFKLIGMVFVVQLIFITQVFAEESNNYLSKEEVENHKSVSFDGEKEVINNNFNFSIIDGKRESLPYGGTEDLFNSIDKKYANLKVKVPDYDTHHIIGEDNRTRVTATTSFPYRAIVHLSIKFPDTPPLYVSGCTGFLVNEDTVVTAGHCIYDHNQGGWAVEITASPGKNGSNDPYDSYDWETIYTVNGWKDNADREYDYGAIKLRGTPGNTTGWFGYKTTNASDLDPEGKSFNVTGYPCQPPTDSWGTMWRDVGTVTDARARTLLHNADTTGCQSGSPVYRNYSDTGQTAIGIHTAGATTHNIATRITNSVFDNIQSWSE